MDEGMDDIMTCRELIQALLELPPDAPVMIAVIKYPEEFALRVDVEGELSWMDSTDVEVVPLERDEVTLQRGNCVTIAVELADYDAQRHFAGG